MVYNCGGYESEEIIKELASYIDVWLPDLKYFSSELSSRYSKAPDYFTAASKAIKQMIRQTGAPQFDSEGALMKKGVIIRHMVLPGAKEDSIRLLHWMKDELPEGMYYISLMSQYTPFYRSESFPEINRRITSYEYGKVLDEAIRLGLDQGFMQEKKAAQKKNTRRPLIWKGSFNKKTDRNDTDLIFPYNRYPFLYYFVHWS